MDLPDPGIEPGSPALQADSLPTERPGKPLRSAAGVQFLEPEGASIFRLSLTAYGIFPDQGSNPSSGF